MAGHFLARSGPPELLLCILQLLESPRDILSFALTCRFMSEVWHANGAGYTVVWRLWSREIPYAEEGLILVRATRVVADAEQKGELPPKRMKLPRPWADKHPGPNASELHAVWQMHHYTEALTLCFEMGNYKYPKDLPWDVQPEKASRVAEWRDGVQRAIYRSLIITTALVGAYTEPLFEAQESHTEQLSTSTANNKPQFSSQLLKFVHGFPIYKLQPTQDDQNQLFGSPAQWLLEHILADTKSRKAMEERFENSCGRAKECQSRGDCPLKLSSGKGSHSDAHVVALEIMRVLWMCENITRKVTIKNLRGKEDKIMHNIGPVALFGKFSLWAIDYTDSADAGWFGTQFISSFFHMQGNNYKSNIEGLLECVHACSGEPNYFEASGAPTTPLRLKFFEYCLRHHVSAAFCDDFFINDPSALINSNLDNFLYCATLFSLDDEETRQRIDEEGPVHGSADLLIADFLDGSEVLASSASSPTLYYDRKSPSPTYHQN
ncbi:hypothetical protein A9K55_001215 [Cordyceps militaris]|uniref:F-box domain-containing protein n=1 Tax=Cordyceps militaris TaxID=73501 RepID=A0A2H4SST2_CORMI|nr:hypothetical protein A9K55_001215 [Cordyceps militaris]